MTDTLIDRIKADREHLDDMPTIAPDAPVEKERF